MHHTVPLALYHSFRQVRLLTDSTPPMSRSSPEEAGSYGATTHTRRVNRPALDSDAVVSGSPTPYTQEAASSSTTKKNKLRSDDDAIVEVSQQSLSKVLALEHSDVRSTSSSPLACKQ